MEDTAPQLNDEEKALTILTEEVGRGRLCSRSVSDRELDKMKLSTQVNGLFLLLICHVEVT
jgi:hypothetical protein